MTPLRTPRGKSDARGADVFRAIGILFEAAMQRVKQRERGKSDDDLRYGRDIHTPSIPHRSGSVSTKRRMTATSPYTSTYAEELRSME